VPKQAVPLGTVFGVTTTTLSLKKRCDFGNRRGHGVQVEFHAFRRKP
jgi:hypothetical protein